MPLSEASAGSSSPESVALGQALSFFGTVADYAARIDTQDGERIAATAVGMAAVAGLSPAERDALYFAARLRNAGALGNAGFAKGEPQNERSASIARWDVPPEGARTCERILCLPDGTADIVRWQAECWDGTGYPDQLRWSGIPPTAQLLHIAVECAPFADLEEALPAISAGSGRTFAPEQARTFLTWFHAGGGRIDPVEPPYASLDAQRSSPDDIFEMLSQRVDAHNGTPGRAERVGQRAQEIGRAMGFAPGDLQHLELACRLFGIGELQAEHIESAQFDALARLGIQTRADHAVRASRLLAECAALAPIAPIVRARTEWYDGTGAPDRLRHDAIPPAARVLSLAIAYDAIEQAYRSRIIEERTLPIARLETAAGTQFDPESVRALAEVLKARA